MLKSFFSGMPSLAYVVVVFTLIEDDIMLLILSLIPLKPQVTVNFSTCPDPGSLDSRLLNVFSLFFKCFGHQG